MTRRGSDRGQHCPALFAPAGWSSHAKQVCRPESEAVPQKLEASIGEPLLCLLVADVPAAWQKGGAGQRVPQGIAYPHLRLQLHADICSAATPLV